MAKLNGGEFLLDLTPMEVEESVDTETYTSITNADVLKQLTNLKRYIPNPSAIKPVWVKFVNSETDEIVVVKGELSKVIDSDEFDIHVKTKGYDLTIHVEFTQALNEDEDPIDDWYIDTNDAKYLFTSNIVSSGTKLYKHNISYNSQQSISCVLPIENLVDANNTECLGGGTGTNTDGESILIYYCSITYDEDIEKYEIHISGYNEDLETFFNSYDSNINDIQDVVTPL